MTRSRGGLFIVKTTQNTAIEHRRHLSRDLAALRQQIELALMTHDSACGHLQELIRLEPSPETENITHQQSQIAFHLKALAALLEQAPLQPILSEGKTLLEELGPF